MLMLPSGDETERPLPCPLDPLDTSVVPELMLRMVPPPADRRAPGGMVLRFEQGGLLCSAVEGSGATAVRIMDELAVGLDPFATRLADGAGNVVLGAATVLAWAATTSETGR